MVFTFVRRASGGGAKRYIPASRRKMSSARHARPSGVASAPGAIWTGSCTGGIGLQIADVLHCCRFRQYHLAPDTTTPHPLGCQHMCDACLNAFLLF